MTSLRIASSRSSQSESAYSRVDKENGCRRDGDQRSDDDVSEPVSGGADAPDAVAQVALADERGESRSAGICARDHNDTVSYHAVVRVHHFLHITRQDHL